MANAPVPRYLRKAYQDFSGGLNDFDSPLVVKQNQFAELTNARVNFNGLLEKHKGYAVDGSPFPDDVDSFIRMLVNYRRGTTVDKLVCAALDEGNTNATYKVDLKATSGDGVYAYFGHTAGTEANFTSGNTAVTGVSTTWLSHLKAGDKIKATGHADSAYTEISAVTNDTTLVLVGGGYLGATAAATQYVARKILNKDFIPQAAVFNNNLVITNGSDTPMTYNNTTLNNITDTQAPKGKFIEPHKSRIFIASTSGGPSSIFWSAVNDETSWDAAAFEIVFANDNGNICGIKSFADSLIVLKDNGNIYQVIGSFDQDAVGEADYIRKIDVPTNMGTIAGFSVCTHEENKLVFLAETGVYTLDPKGYIQKISWNIQNETDSIVLSSGVPGNKSYVMDTKAQWDDGTHSGTKATTDGTLENFFDEYSITDAVKGNELVSSVLDANDVMHVAYLSSSDSKTIIYKTYSILGAVTSANAVTATEVVYNISMDVSLVGKVGIAYVTAATPGANNTVRFVEYRSSAWQTSIDISSVAGTEFRSLCLKYRSDEDARLFWIIRSGTVDFGHFKQTGTSWSAGTTNSTLYTSTSQRLNMILVADIPKVIFQNDPTTLYYFNFSDDCASFSRETIAITAGNVFTPISLAVNSTSQVIAMWGDNGALKKRNFNTATTATLDSNSGYGLGHALNATNNETYVRLTSGGTETIIYNDSTAVANPATIPIDTTYYPSSSFSKNGVVYGYALFGSNANEILLRRYAPIASYISAENSDSTLSAWSTLVQTGETANGNTLTYAVALNSISPAVTYTPVLSGAIISTDPTLIFVNAKVSIALLAWAKSAVSSLTLNYTGTGKSAVMPCGVVFDNEMYISYANSGDTANSKCLLLDKEGAWQLTEYPITFMVRYLGRLYGGGSTTGKIYKLIQDYRAGSSAYTMTATSKEDLLGSLELQKEVYKIYIIYQIKSAGTFDFSYRVDNFATSGGSSWVTTTVDQTQDGIAEIPGISGNLKSIQFKIESNGLDEQVGVVGWVVVYGYSNLR